MGRDGGVEGESGSRRRRWEAGISLANVKGWMGLNDEERGRRRGWRAEVISPLPPEANALTFINLHYCRCV